MLNLFEGLEKFGIKNINNLEIYKKEKKATDDTKAEAAVELTAEDCLFDKKVTCPVCENEFTSRTIKQGKAKLVSTETDLRSYFEPVDPLFYDITSCTRCGFTTLNSSFRSVPDRISDKILKELTPNFKPIDYPPIYTTEIAIERYKLALLNCLLRNSKDGEKAYICMKLAWLHRDLPDPVKEAAYQKEAVKGFINAFQNDSFPICGLDEKVLTYMIGETLRRLGDYEDAGRWLSRIAIDKTANARLRDRAMEQRNEVKKVLERIAKVSAPNVPASPKGAPPHKGAPLQAPDTPAKKKFKLF